MRRGLRREKREGESEGRKRKKVGPDEKGIETFFGQANYIIQPFLKEGRPR